MKKLAVILTTFVLIANCILISSKLAFAENRFTDSSLKAAFEADYETEIEQRYMPVKIRHYYVDEYNNICYSDEDDGKLARRIVLIGAGIAGLATITTGGILAGFVCIIFAIE